MRPMVSFLQPWASHGVHGRSRRRAARSARPAAGKVRSLHAESLEPRLALAAAHAVEPTPIGPPAAVSPAACLTPSPLMTPPAPAGPSGGPALAAAAAASPMPATFVGIGTPQILLTSDTLDRLRQMAAAQTPQWQAFRDRLDGNLDVVIADETGAYQGSQLNFICDYSLGYQVLKESDPRTAASYADKAISLMRSGVHDFQKGFWVARQLLARGDGSTSTFTLPHADVHPGTLTVFLGDITTRPVVHGAAGGQDAVADYQTFLEASDAPTGPATYAAGIDWRYDADFPNDRIDWSPQGGEPAAGATYYVTSTSGLEAVRTDAFSLLANRITFATPPRTDQTIFVQYIHGSHSSDGSTLDYQDTSAGDGGFNSIFIDDTYTSRSLGLNLAICLDWLDGYAGLKLGLEEEVASLLVRWADWLATPNVAAVGGYNGYLYTSALSNYGAGTYGSLVMTALALGPRSPDGPRLVDAAVDYRNRFVLPAIESTVDSAKGGFWSEGWNYGHNAVQRLLLGSKALETAGKITATAERRWATEIVDELNSEQPAPGFVYDGGEVYQYPFRLLDRALFYVLSDMASGAAQRAYANHYVQAYPDAAFLNPKQTADFRDLLFRDPAATAASWSDQPLQRLATGTGLLTARSDWDATPTWLALQMGNILPADHQTYAPGQLLISRGSDQLLANALQIEHVFGNNSAGPGSLSQFGNVVAVNNGGALNAYGYPLQNTPFCMGTDYGKPGVVISRWEGTPDHVYLDGDYHAAYSYAENPGGGGPTSRLTRQVVYLRPGSIIVYDRVATKEPQFAKELHWHFTAAPVVSGDAFVETVGTSRLFGRTFSSSPLETAAAQLQVAGSPSTAYHRVTTRNTDTAADVAFLTVFQTAPAATATMDPTTRVVSDDGRLEGARTGDRLVLFGRAGTVDLTVSTTYSLAGPGSVATTMVNVPAGTTHRVVADGRLLCLATASSAGVLSFTTPAGARAIEVGLSGAVPAAPAAPTNLVARAADAGATVSWSPPVDDGGSPIVAYALQRTTDGGTTWITVDRPASAATTAVVTGLVNGATYRFRVSAVNAAGTGAASVESADVRPHAAPVVAIEGSVTPRVTTYGTPSTAATVAVTATHLVETLVATAPVGFEVSADGVVFGTSARFTPTGGAVTGMLAVRLTGTASAGSHAGSIALSTADMLPSAVPLPASSVTARSLTLSGLSAHDKVYDGTTAAHLVGTPLVSGVLGGDDVAVRGLAVGAFSSKQAGTAREVTIGGLTLAGAQAGNYSLVLPRLVATIAPRAVVVRADDQTRTVRTANPPLTATVVGLVAGDTAATALAGRAALSTTATMASPVGFYPIKATRGTLVPLDGNYTLSFVPGKLRLIARPGAPIRPRATPGDHQATLSWTAPLRKGGTPVIDYLVEYRRFSAADWTPLVRAASSATTAVVTGLLNDRRYVFRVSARNAAGTSAASAVSPPVTPHA